MKNIKNPKARCDITLGESMLKFLYDLNRSIKEDITRKTAEIIIKLDSKLYPLNKYTIQKLIKIDPIKILKNKFKL